MRFSTGESGAKIRVLVADSSQTQSDVLAHALKRQPRFKVNTCHAEVSECISALQAATFDVLLIGAELEEDLATLCKAIRKIHSSFPKTAIVVLINSYDRFTVISSFRSGANALFCLSSQPFKALCKCIHVVHNGQYWISDEQVKYLVEALPQTTPSSVTDVTGKPLLTARENQVATLVAEGLSNRAIASQLRLTENTIKKSLLRIFEKLGISNRVELVLYALTQRGPQDAKTEGTAVVTQMVQTPRELASQHRKHANEPGKEIPLSYKAS